MHESPFCGHRGQHQTYAAIRDKFYWPAMQKAIAKYISSCEECNNNKINRGKPLGYMQKLQKPTAPGQILNMDFITDLPRSLFRGSYYDSILVIVDRFSRRVYAYPSRMNMTATEFTELFIHEHVLNHMNGIPAAGPWWGSRRGGPLHSLLGPAGRLRWRTV